MSNNKNNMFYNLITSGAPGNLDSENIRKIILINIYSSIGIFFMILLGIMDLFEHKLVLSSILFCFATLFVFFFFYLRHTKNYFFPGYSVVSMMFLLALYLLYTGGTDKSGYVWYYVLPATSLFILGRVRGFIFILASFILAIAILYMFPSMNIFQDHACTYSTILKFRFMASYVSVAILSFVFESTRNKSYILQLAANEKAEQLLKESLKNQEVIQQQNSALEFMNKELEKLSIVASETDNAITIASVEGLIEWVNAGFTKLYGYTHEEFIKERGANVIKASTNTEILELIIECLGCRQPVIYTSPNQTKDGKNIWVQTTMTPVFDASGAIHKLVIIDTDISKIKEVEEEIIQQNEEIKQQNEEIKAQRDQLEDINQELEKLSIVARETDNSVVIADKNGEIEWVNEGFNKLWGYTIDEFKSAKGSNILNYKNNKFVSDLISDCITNKRSVSYVIPATNKYNHSIWLQITLSPILDLMGSLSRLVAIEVEITNIKEAEEEIRQQNEEIKQQNEELSTQRDNLNEAYQSLFEKNQMLDDSIQYAKLIQTSILPKDGEIRKYVPDSFLFFKPKATVSGDFYWFYGYPDKFIVAVADCTGHGVPGAFMSMIGNTLLNRIVKEESIIDPAIILEKLNAGVIDALNQGAGLNETQEDGMDISICYADLQKKELTIACANQIVFITQNNKPEMIKGSIYSIGGLISYKSHPHFSNQTYAISQGTTVYLLSDGYQDQFGGFNYDKFGMTRFEKLLTSIQSKTMEEQLKVIETTHEEWRGAKNQTDDILILGIKF